MKIDIDQYVLAWNKLLELVLFGQKSESLGLAKLLGHYMNDRILAMQLQADLYLLFKDIPKSQELYTKVIDLYLQNSDENKSRSISEHLKLITQKVTN